VAQVVVSGITPSGPCGKELEPSEWPVVVPIGVAGEATAVVAVPADATARLLDAVLPLGVRSRGK
jgi:hypothetical protein